MFMRLRVHARAVYELSTDSFVALMVEPALKGSAHALVQESLTTTPTMSSALSTDPFGNPQRHLMARQGPFFFDFAGTIEAAPNAPVPIDAVEHVPQELPIQVRQYTLPSRYCQSDLLTRMAQGEFGLLARGGGRVLTIADWVRTRVEYRYGTTTSLTSAYDTATERIGVCRDFAHLVIAFCRALDIPARYVSGYALGLEPPDFHGYAQVYLSGAWHNVDATSQELRPALVPIAVGRDAADVPITTLWTAHELREQSCAVELVS